jgi:hypothetical protein
MSRTPIPYLNTSEYGQGLEGLINWTNVGLTGGWMISAFLLVFYGLSLYVSSKSEWKLGGIIAMNSFVFFILGMIAQIFTTVNQMVIFIFFVGILVGIVMSFIENAKT